MKNLILFIFAALMSVSFNLTAADDDCASSTLEEDGYCRWQCNIYGIKDGGHYDYGKPLYFKCEPKYRHDVYAVKLYVDGHYKRTESKYPFEWGKGNSDSYLRHLSPGKHKICWKIKDRCGEWHQICCWIYIDKGGYDPYPPQHDYCKYDCYFKYPSKNKHYRYGEPVYVNLAARGYQHIEYAELWLNGKHMGKESRYPYEWGGKHSRNPYWKKLSPGHYKLKCKIKDKCGEYETYHWEFWVDEYHAGGGGHGHCEYKCWFDYPKQGHCEYGRPTYVKLGAKGYDKIKYVEAWCDKQYLGKESRYPYEWGKGRSHSYLRHLKKGRHLIKCKIVDYCGDERW